MGKDCRSETQISVIKGKGNAEAKSLTVPVISHPMIR